MRLSRVKLRPRGRVAQVEAPYPTPDPFWRILERQTKIEVLARSLADAASFVAPEGRFEWRDNTLGMRVFRPEADARIWIVALLRDRRLTCRVDGEGAVAMWLD